MGSKQLKNAEDTQLSRTDVNRTPAEQRHTYTGGPWSSKTRHGSAEKHKGCSTVELCQSLIGACRYQMHDVTICRPANLMQPSCLQQAKNQETSRARGSVRGCLPKKAKSSYYRGKLQVVAGCHSRWFGVVVVRQGSIIASDLPCHVTAPYPLRRAIHRFFARCNQGDCETDWTVDWSPVKPRASRGIIIADVRATVRVHNVTCAC